MMLVRNVGRIRSAVARRVSAGVERARARMANARRPVILMYHRIANETFDPWGLAVAPDNFAAQLSWLASNRKLMALTEFAALHRRGHLPDDAVAVTFDDGYACTATVAAPLLERYEIPATVFLPAGLIGGTGPFWWDRLSHMVMAHPGATIRARGRTLDLGERRGSDATWPRDNRRRTRRQKAFHALWAELQPLPLDQIEHCLDELRSQQGRMKDDDVHRLMTEEEVRSIASANIQFGSHAMTHVSLPGLGRAEKAREIRESVEACERLVGTRPQSFAYPFGDFDRECEELVAEAGFACACTVQRRTIAADDNAFALPRMKVGNWSWRQLRQELALIACKGEPVAIDA